MKDKICFYCADQNPHRDRSLGITGYTHGLIDSLGDLGECDIWAITSLSSYAPSLPAPRTRQLCFRTDRIPGRLLADHGHSFLIPDECSTVHYPKGYVPCLRPRGKFIVATVHDAIPQYYLDHYPQSRSNLGLMYWVKNSAHALRTVDAVCTVSNFAKESILAFCDRYAIQAPPIIVTYQGCRWMEGDLPLAAKTDAAVHLSSTEPHKRTATLLQFWARLQQRSFHLPALILVGPLSQESAQLASRLKNVQTKPRLCDDDLRSLMAQARLLILPSEIEGFGLPALEAFMLGTPVLYVKDTAVEEVLGSDTPGGFDLGDVDSFEVALQAGLEMGTSSIRRKRAQLSKDFNWKDCARRTLAAYSWR